MSTTDSWTIGRLLQWTADYLKEHGSESPRLDAEVLLAHARGCQRIELYTCFDEVANDTVREEFRELVKRRATGTPVAYLVRQREFYSKVFQVTPDVLIPRPETEFVLVGLFDLLKAQSQQTAPLQLADVGTGSGILAICAALQLPNAQIVAIDISRQALQIAKINAQQHAVTSRIQFVESDVFKSVDAEQRFDYIIANPPYIGLDEKPSLPRDVVGFEPHQALFGGPRGLDVLAELVVAAAERLTPGGWLLSEFNPAQRADVEAMVKQQSVLESPQFIDDLTHRPRVVQVRRRPAAAVMPSSLP